ncbi:MAG TPA: hypothetical protein VF988_09125 [Verrucomicrobiae bacterium]
MREYRKYLKYLVPALKVSCLVLAFLVSLQLTGIVKRWNPFRSVTVPALPTLAASTNAPTGRTDSPPALAAVSGTNSKSKVPGTNGALPVATGTNLASPAMALSAKTNAPATTNTVMAMTNAPTLAANTNADTNHVALLEDVLARTNSNATTATNLAVGKTNVLLSSAPSVGTNLTTNSVKAVPKRPPTPPRGMAGMGPGGFPGSGNGSPELPAAVKTRISKIVDSEILAPVMHPLPQALLGIAGNAAFLRSANGQTGLVKEGDSLDDIKLLRIGINRVLIEQGGEKKELTIFDGYGSDSLLSNNSTNENAHP